MVSIELIDISKSFGDKNVIKNINLKVEGGQLVTLLGPSGCGKSTTLKIISGLLSPECGNVLFNSSSVLNIPTEKRGSTIVFQEYLLFPHMTLEENIGFGLKMAGVNRNKRNSVVKEMLDLVQLNGHEKKYPSEISGGQKQRVALARALAINPRVLLLDEPFSSLDQKLRESMREFVSDIQRKLKITTIMVTHDKEEALMMADKVAVMIDGSIVQFGTPKEVYQSPKTKEIADFFGNNNYIDGTINNYVLNCPLGEFSINNGNRGKGLVMIRLEDIKVSAWDRSSLLQGTITKKKFAGDRVYYNILINGIDFKSIGNSKTLFDVNDKVSVNIDFYNSVFYPN